MTNVNHNKQLIYLRYFEPYFEWIPNEVSLKIFSPF